MTTLDLRNLPAPEPLQRALAAADALNPGETIDVLTPLLPGPLLELLSDRGLRFRTAACGDGGVRVSIERPA